MSGQLTKKEHYSYLFAAFGQGAIYAMMSSWLGRFYTDVMGLSGYFIMALMWVARIWDAVNDPMMGMIVDRTRTKWGKMRPYIGLSAPLAIALTILIFVKPNIGQTGLMVYAAFTYIAWGMTYTLGDVPFWGLPSAMVENSGERSRFISVSRTFNSVGSALPILLVALISTDKVLGQRKGYLVSAIVFAVCGGLLYLNSFFSCKERVIPSKEKPSVKENLALIRQNKPLLIAVSVGILAFGRYMVQGAISYAADYVFVADGFIKSNLMLISSALIAVGMFPAMLVMPALFKRFNFKQIVVGSGIFSFVIGLAFFLTSFFTGYKALIAFPFLFLSGFPLGVFNVITYAIIADSIDYLEWKTGKRNEGLSFSTQTFMNKLGAAISAGFIPLILEIVKYNKPVNDVLQPQSDGAKLAIFLMITLIPGISLLISVIPMLKYDYVGEKKERVLRELKERKAALAEAEEQREVA